MRPTSCGRLRSEAQGQAYKTVKDGLKALKKRPAKVIYFYWRVGLVVGEALAL